MAIRPIVKLGDDVLRIKAKPVTEFDEKLATLIEDMKETMIRSNGVGLAAPQVGILKRVCVVSVDGKTFYELINPVIVKATGKQIGPEGCLSVPGVSGEVERPKKLVVDGVDRNGDFVRFKVSDYEAVAFCHEMDHLDGILFIDKVIRHE